MVIVILMVAFLAYGSSFFFFLTHDGTTVLEAGVSAIPIAFIAVFICFVAMIIDAYSSE